MALRIRRMIVRPAADIGPAQNNVRTKAVKCRGAYTVYWIGRATNANVLAAATPFVSNDPAFDAPVGNFVSVSAGGEATVAQGFAGPGLMNTGGKILAAISHESGGPYPMLPEQAELRFNSHATLTINGLEIEAVVIDEVGADSHDSGLVNAT